MSAEEVTRFLDNVFPQMHAQGRIYQVEAIEDKKAVVLVTAGKQQLRPGGTVSGPTLMTLADFASYAAILGNVGPKALAVTTNLNINFLRKAEAGVLVATCRIIKLGKRLVVTDCEIMPQGGGEMIAHATSTYSIPPQE
ncbi:PaaI family thioesterase [Pseudovibrio sp. SPO723]|uniref:PaaI family thioesterase n=1 Tax=Nesiotobacter zosterae TaxID=392721 RepID=UPI0029C45F42|nr:PaaI family thioesterase [Pseudovibrio sp. SPO723]MDX5592618.1 PaaI family thioesterase [Pseudovibrio sp. SPO723]